MFGLGIMGMVGNYESRKVDNTEVNNAVIDTVRITDSVHNYETGVTHPAFNDNAWIIVEEYDTKEQAQKGHDKWVKEFTDKLPKTIKDISTCEVVNRRII